MYTQYHKLETYQEFILYCLRQLGAPVVNIEVDDDQIRDRITDALQFYRELDSESVHEFWWLYTITESDVSNSYIKMPEEVISIDEIITTASSYSTPQIDNIDSPEFQYWNGFWNSYQSSGLIYYETTMQHLSLIRKVLSSDVLFAYRTRERKIYPYRKLEAGNVICLHGYKMIDPESDDTIWESMFLKKYATALIGMQWGTNISKFGNIPSIGGVTLNGDAILVRYTQEKVALEEEHKLKYQEPVQGIFWG